MATRQREVLNTFQKFSSVTINMCLQLRKRLEVFTFSLARLIFDSMRNLLLNQ